MPGKLWNHEEEELLRRLWDNGIRDLKVLSEKVKRPEGAVREKSKRMGLRVVVEAPRKRVTTTPVPLEGLVTHEEALKVLAGVLAKLREPGQDKVELQRLRILVVALQTYDSVLEKFERWSEIEKRILEMDEKIAELQKAQKMQA
jgi:hypothetical protein